MTLFLESSQSVSGHSGQDPEGDQEQSQIKSRRKSNEWNFNIIDDKVGIESQECGRCSIKGGWSYLECSGDHGKEEGCTFYQKEGDQVEEELLIVRSNRQETKLFGKRQQLFNGGQVNTIRFQTGKNAGVHRGTEQVEFADATNDIVLCRIVYSR